MKVLIKQEIDSSSIKAMIFERGLNQFAKGLNMPASYLSDILNNKKTVPLETFKLICSALNLNPDDYLCKKNK